MSRLSLRQGPHAQDQDQRTSLVLRESRDQNPESRDYISDENIQ